MKGRIGAIAAGFRNKWALPALLVLACSPGVVLADGASTQRVVNPTGGVLANTSDGLRWVLGSNSQFQVYLGGSGQVYGPTSNPTSGSMFNSVFLRVDRGTAATNRIYQNSDANYGVGANGELEFTQVSQSAISGAGTAASPWVVTTVLRPSVAADNAITMTITDSYVRPQAWLTRRISLSGLPAAATIKLYQKIDTYLQGSDSGPGFSRTSPWNTTGRPDLVGVTRNDTFQALWYEPSSGTPHWDRYFSGHYDYPPRQICRGTDVSSTATCPTGSGNLSNVIDTTNVDNGIAAQWNVPAGATTFTAEYRITFATGAAELSKEFSPQTIYPNGVSTLTFDLTNRSINSVASINFLDTLPTGVQVAATPNVRTNCPAGGTLGTTLPSGMSVVATAGGGSIQVTGASLLGAPANGVLVCQVSVDVTSSTVGQHHNQSANISATNNLVNLVGDEVLEVIAQPNFGTCDARMFLSQSANASTNTTLHGVNAAANPLTLPVLGQGSRVYNATGYSPSDNYLYAISYGTAASNSLIRIGSNGSTVDLGAVGGLPAGFYNAGAFNGTGTYYVMSGGAGASNSLYAINLATRTATLINLSASFQPGDLAWTGGLLYAVDGAGQLRSINPANGAVTSIGTPSGAVALGALYGAANGLFGAAEGGGFHRIDVVSGARMQVAGSPATAFSDGANCPTASLTLPADLAITKTDGNPTYTPGTNVIYTVTVSNLGPFGAQGATVADPLPAGITTANWSCAATSGGSVCRTASGSGALNAVLDLPSGAVATFTLTMAVPADFSGDLVNTATVAPGAGNTDPVPGNNTATDTNTQNSQVNLSITKSNSLGSAVTGGMTTYTLVAGNTGPSAANGVVVRDDWTTVPGLNCSTAAGGTATCAASGAAGTQCPAPASVTPEALQAGLTVPMLPNGAVLTFTLQCRVAATGQ